MRAVAKADVAYGGGGGKRTRFGFFRDDRRADDGRRGRAGDDALAMEVLAKEDVLAMGEEDDLAMSEGGALVIAETN